MFDSVIGVAMMEPVTVELAFSCKQAMYIKTLPLQRSQEIFSETEDEVVFSLFVAPNYELVQRILMYGCEVDNPDCATHYGVNSATQVQRKL